MKTPCVGFGDAIVLERHAFLVVWLIVFVMRTVTVLALALLMWYFYFISQNSDIQELWRLDVHALSSGASKHVLMMVVFIWVCHVYRLAQMVHASTTSRSLRFVSYSRFAKQSPGRHAVQNRRASGVPEHQESQEVFDEWRQYAPQLQNCWHLLRGLRGDLLLGVKTLWRWVVQFIGLFGIQSKWFNEVYAMRETIELITQMLQVHYMQCLVANDAINLVSTATLFIGSIATWTVEFWTKEFERKSMKTRLVLLLVDALMDFVFATGFQLGVGLTMLGYLNLSTMVFNDDQLYDDIWFPTAIREIRQFTLSSIWDIGTMAIFHFGLLYCLRRVQSFVIRKDQVDAIVQQQTARSHQLEHFGHSRTLRHSKHQLVPSQRISQMTGPLVSSVTVPSRSYPLWVSWLSGMVLHWLPLLHVLTGLLAVVASFHSRFATSKPMEGCKLVGYEWFKSQQACIVLEINCHRHGIAGQRQILNQILRQSDTKWLMYLLFSHCSSLEIPEAVREIPSLFLLEIYNSTLQNWSVNASLTQQTNPEMTYLRVCRTIFGVVASPGSTDLQKELVQHYGGLFDNPEPSKRLRKYVFTHTNLPTLPQQVEQSWRYAYSLNLDHGVLDEVPSVLSKLQSLDFLSLVNNSIRSIPDQLLEQLTFIQLRMSGNPLQELSSSNGSLSALARSCFVQLEHTLLDSMPPWFETFLRRLEHNHQLTCNTTLYGSPVCANRFTRRLVHAINASESVDWLLSKCVHDFDSIQGWPGLERVDVQRRV